MYKNIQDFQVGSLFVQERPFSSMVVFVVDRIENGRVSAKSKSISGFDFAFDQGYMDKCHARKKYFFTSLDAAIDHKRAAESKRMADLVEQYATDPEAFVAMVIKRAYEADLDPEYGDYVQAKSVKQLAAIHFPKVALP